MRASRPAPVMVNCVDQVSEALDESFTSGGASSSLIWSGRSNFSVVGAPSMSTSRSESWRNMGRIVRISMGVSRTSVGMESVLVTEVPGGESARDSTRSELAQHLRQAHRVYLGVGDIGEVAAVALERRFRGSARSLNRFGGKKSGRGLLPRTSFPWIRPSGGCHGPLSPQPTDQRRHRRQYHGPRRVPK